MTSKVWALKYRPKTFDEFIFSDSSKKELVERFVKERNFPHLLLSGQHGTGKTSLAFLLKSLLNVDDNDFLILNGSDENGVDIVRDKIGNFVKTMSNSIFKIVFIDEGDYLSKNAQGTLRNMMETYADNAKFIITCNYPNKLIPELKSRMLILDFKSLDKEAMELKIVDILKQEHVQLPTLELLDEYIDLAYPDLRKILTSIQFNVKDGKLAKSSEIVSENTTFMLKLLNCVDVDDWVGARKLLSSSPSNDWEEFYKFLYEYLPDMKKYQDVNKWKSGIVIINDHLFKHAFSANPEINFISCLIRLSNI